MIPNVRKKIIQGVVEHMDNTYKMKLIKELESGDIILHPLYRLDGLMLINSYRSLSEDLIDKITNHLPHTLPVLITSSKKNLDYIIDNEVNRSKKFIDNLKLIATNTNKLTNHPISIDTFIDEPLYTNDENIDENIDLKLNHKEIDVYHLFYSMPFFSSFQNILDSQDLKNRTKKLKNMLIDTIVSNDELYNLLIQLKNYKNIILIHSINVTTASLLIGLTLELTDDDLIDLCLAALYSNIGYLEIPKEQFDYFLKNHGDDIDIITKQLEVFMKTSKDIPLLRKDSIIYGVLDRNEAINGTGIPNKKRGKEISLFGKILAIAQSYDILVGGYLYNNGISPAEAINEIWKKKSVNFDENILLNLIHKTTTFKLGSYITYHKNKKAEIIGFSNYLESPHLPIIKLNNGLTIDLTKK
jgi:HD-GYP domain-containing protein (c-di-GMP phosphodiesterase class II)